MTCSNCDVAACCASASASSRRHASSGVSPRPLFRPVVAFVFRPADRIFRWRVSVFARLADEDRLDRPMPLPHIYLFLDAMSRGRFATSRRSTRFLMSLPLLTPNTWPSPRWTQSMYTISYYHGGGGVLGEGLNCSELAPPGRAALSSRSGDSCDSVTSRRLRRPSPIPR